MDAKEYLSQAQHLDALIDCKMERLERLNALATKCTTTLTGMPKSQSSSTSRMEDVVLKIISLQEELAGEIDGLIELQAEITDVINAVKDSEQRLVLEERYLSCFSWKKIAVSMGYDERQVYRIHGEALKSVKIPKHVSKCQ